MASTEHPPPHTPNVPPAALCTHFVLLMLNAGPVISIWPTKSHAVQHAQLMRSSVPNITSKIIQGPPPAYVLELMDLLGAAVCDYRGQGPNR